MNDKDILTDRIRALHRERSHLLTLPPEKALERILESPQPAALVHAMPEEDFYFLLHDIGIEDALPILSLATETQLEYILDLEGWHRDQIRMPELTKWLDLFLQAQPQRFLSWLIEEKAEFTAYFLNKNVQVLFREHDEDPSDFGEDFFTFDDVVYFRPLPNPVSLQGEEIGDGIKQQENEEKRLSFLKNLIRRIADYDHIRYQHMMINTKGILPAEAEEEFFRLRNIRLAEKGFLPFNEAVGVYQPLSAEELIRRPVKRFSRPDEEMPILPVPRYPVGMIRESTPFSDALSLVDSAETLEHLQVEFALLCNRIISADQRLIQEKTGLGEIVRKACGYLSIGLEVLSEEAPENGSVSNKTPLRTAVLTRYPLADIFRVGYGRVLHLKWRVERWQKTAWFTANHLPLSFWGETWMGILGGLLIKKPQCFDNFQTGRMYREFESAADLNQTENAVTQILAMDDLLSRMNLQGPFRVDSLLTFKNLLLTLWAGQYLDPDRADCHDPQPAPLTKEEFGRFFKALFRADTIETPRRPRKTVTEMKSSFLDWLIARTGDSAATLTGQVGDTLESLFEEVDAELGAIGIADLDPRFIYLFKIKPG